MQTGWVKLHRGLLDWEWYDDANTCRLFIHCLLRANHADKIWKGKDIKRGSFFTSLDTLSSELKLSVRQIRTSLDKLVSTGELTSSGQARGRMIAVSNYEEYQNDDKLNVSEKAGLRQAGDKLTTTNKNDKNVRMKELENINTLFSESGMTDFQITELNRIRKANKGGKITERVAKSLINELKQAVKIGWPLDDSLTEWESRGWKSFKSEWVTPKIQGVSNEGNQRPATARPDNSAAGRVRQNVAKGIAEDREALAEVHRHQAALESNVIDVRPQVDKLIR